MEKKVLFLCDEQNDWFSHILRPYVKKLNQQNNNYKASISFKIPKTKYFEIVFLMNLTYKVEKNFLKNFGVTLLIHESDLPKGKGYAPIQWQLLENKNKIKSCLIMASDNVDSGDIVDSTIIKFKDNELYDKIRKKQFDSHLLLIDRFLSNFPKFRKQKQKGSSTYYRKRMFGDSELNINRSIKNQFNLLRIANNEKWPAFIRNKNSIYKLKIYETNIEELIGLEIRMAKPKDSRDIWLIRNDPLTRKMFRVHKYVKWDDHNTWYKDIIVNKKSKIFIGYSKNTDEIIGYVRFDIDKQNNFHISVSLKSTFRGFGLSTKFLLMSFKTLREKNVLFIAEIYDINKASKKIFKNLGFKKYKQSRSLNTFRAYKREILGKNLPLDNK